jgi:hypothetical protein
VSARGAGLLTPISHPDLDRNWNLARAAADTMIVGISDHGRLAGELARLSDAFQAGRLSGAITAVDSLMDAFRPLQRSRGSGSPLALQDRVTWERLLRLRDRLLHIHSLLHDLKREWKAASPPAEPDAVPSAAVQAQPPTPTPVRRVPAAAGIAARILPPEHRARYREEWAAELADIARPDQPAYAFRLVTRSWAQRRALTSKPNRSTTVSLRITGPAVGVAAAFVTAVTTGTTAIFFGIMTIAGLGFAGWVLISPARTAHLIEIITAARGGTTARKEHRPPD